MVKFDSLKFLNFAIWGLIILISVLLMTETITPDIPISVYWAEVLAPYVLSGTLLIIAMRIEKAILLLRADLQK